MNFEMMKPSGFHRLHALRMENDAKGFAMDEMRPRFDAMRTRHEDGTAPRAVSAHQLFQTPPDLAALMVELAEIRADHSVLEPSAGLGRLLRPILECNPATVTACDLSPDCLRELFVSFPTVSIVQGDFLARQIGKFDRIVMNPPFHMRADIRHTLHALEHLAPGGVLVGLCMAGSHRECILRPLSDHWEAIPAGTFQSEGTGIATVLFRISR